MCVYVSLYIKVLENKVTYASKKLLSNKQYTGKQNNKSFLQNPLYICH